MNAQILTLEEEEMFNKMRIHGFKKFEEVEVHLQPFTVLMGENSAGKTTILQAINFALHNLYYRELVQQTKKGIKARDRGVVLMLDDLPGISISNIGEFYYGGKASRSQKDPAIIDLVDTANNTFRLQISSYFNSFNVKCISSDQELSYNPCIASLQPLFISSFVGLRASEERIFPRAIQDKVQTGRMSEIIRNLVFDIREQKRDAYESLINILNEYFGFRVEGIKFDAESDLYISTSFIETRKEKLVSLDFNSSGSGLMQVLQILAPIYRFAPERASVVLIDEPDAHLHPNLQYTLARALKRVQRDLDVQIIISTHSIPIIESAEPYEVVPVSSSMRVNGPLVEEKDVNNAIYRFIDNYHLAKSKVSGKLIFIEDDNIDIIKRFDNILQTRVFLGRNTASVVAGKGKDNRTPFMSKEVLKAYTGQDVEVYFIVDGDGMPEKWREQFTKYAGNRVILHQLTRHEIENYLFSPALLEKALRLKYAHKVRDVPSIEEIKSIMQACMQNTINNGYSYKDGIKDRLQKLVRLAPEKEIILEGDKKKERDKHYSQNDIDSEAGRITKSYRNLSFEQLVNVAKGKETLKEFNKWLTQENKMYLSIREILECVEYKDIPEEIKHLLSQLRLQAEDPLARKL